jgi:hypothetical protein
MLCKCGCGQSFEPVKSWQLFVSPQHRDRWHYQERKRLEVEAAEIEREENRVNGHNGSAEERNAETEKLELVVPQLTLPQPKLVRRM